MIYELDLIDIKQIDYLNQLKNKTIIKLKNTTNLNSKLINNINNNRVSFLINDLPISKEALGLILSYFENIETMINPLWNDIEKTMYIYACIVENTDYATNIDSLVSNLEHNINGILYNKLDKVGFTKIIQELLTRQNIKSQIKEIDNNAICIITHDNNYYAIDPYAEKRNTIFNNGKCNYSFFAQKDNYTDEIPLQTIPRDYLNTHFANISQALLSTKIKRLDLSNHDLSTTELFLPIDIDRKHLSDEANYEYLYYITYSFLRIRNKYTLDSSLINAFSKRIDYINKINNDYERTTVEMRDIGISIFGTQCFISANGDIFNHDRENRLSVINTTIGPKEIIEEEEIKRIADNLNVALKTFINNFLKNIIDNINYYFSNIEPLDNNMDNNRKYIQENIKTKLLFFVESKPYLISIGYNEQEITSIIERITAKLK